MEIGIIRGSLKKRRRGIATILDQWLLLSWTLLVASFLYWGSARFTSGLSISHAAIVTFIAIYTLRPVAKIANRLAAWAFQTLSEVEGSKVVFQFTSGDKKRIAELERDNRKQGRKFMAASAWNLALNVVAGIIYAYLFTRGSP